MLACALLFRLPAPCALSSALIAQPLAFSACRARILLPL